MKNILAATDFSPASRHAIKYAAEMAISFKCQLIIINVYAIPIMTEASVITFSLDELERNCLKKMKRLTDGLVKKYGKKLQLNSQCSCGFAVEEIKLAAKKLNADLIVMGMQGAGYLAEKMNGSVTTSLMADCDCPVLSIGKTMKFSKFKKIVLAADLKEIEHKSFSKLVKELAESYKSKLLVLNVFKPNNVIPTISEANEVMKLDILLKDVKHSFNYVENENVVDGINAFVKKNKADLVIMIGRKHSLFHRLFNEPQTKRMAFHGNTPLLVFHD